MNSTQEKKSYSAHKLEKVVVSMGLGHKSRSQIEKISAHFVSLFKTILDKGKKPQKPAITFCRKSNSKFKIRKGTPCGLILTLRKTKALEFLRLFNEKIGGFSESLIYNNSTLFFGVKDHRSLRLEKYNYEVPSYGFNIAIVFAPLSARISERRINPLKSRTLVPESACKNLYQCI